MGPVWKARPIFISSTFVDMQAERDYLRTRVFPELEERLRARRHHLEWVDLRVGIATAAQRDDEEARELHVLKVCLAEVARCRPFLIVLLGDRYGWVPPPDRARTAAGEAGFSADIAGRSVTDLEIELGVLADRAQQPRSLFYLRDPLPYRDMPLRTAALYSEAYAGADDLAAPDRRARLTALKRRIATLLPDRVRRYAAAWDFEHHRVAGLEAWGRMVLDDIWSELAAETQAAAAGGDLPWQQVERNARDDFAEDRARGFVGRQELLARLSDLAAAPKSAAPKSADPAVGICITGEAGSGKSALFGELYRRLGNTDVFVLAHAAGASVQSASVDLMLRRWIDELAAALGVVPALAENADPPAVEAVFGSLIASLSLQRRVVVLVDALDQLEATTRGRFATWLPRPWPANARLIATAIPGEASQALRDRTGIASLPLPPLDRGEARGIIEAICERYHRTFEPDVIAALLGKTGATKSGAIEPAAPAWGNPLWLVLAVEELNLLDADDFARVQRDYDGEPGERLRALMLDIIARLPADIAALYRRTFGRAEELFGARLARNFLALIAVGRGGWREGDFRALLPRLAGEPWDELRFAQLRRLFRGQLRRRGALAQWDFNHGQMRVAARLHLTACGLRETELNAAIADHLLGLPANDELRESETMVHLLASEDWPRAIRWYGGDLTPAEQQGATRVLIDTTLLPARNGVEGGLARVLHLLDADGADDSGQDILSYQEYAAQRLIYHVLDPLRTRAPLDTQEMLARRIADYFDALPDVDPAMQARFDVQRAASRARLGEAQAARGALGEAEASYQRSTAISDRLARAQPDVLEWQRDHAVGLNHIGKLRLAQGRVGAAAEAFKQSLAVVARVAAARPHEAEWQRDLAIGHANVGDAELAQGNAAAAEASYRAALDIQERLAARQPADLDRQFDLSTIHGALWRLQASRGDLIAAEASARTCIAVLDRLTDRAPDNRQWRHALFIGHRNLGLVQTRREDHAAAEASLRTALAIVDRLARDDPDNTGWQRDVSGACHMLADVLLARGNIADAETAGRAALVIGERLVRQAPANADWQSDLALRHLILGRVREARGDLDAAERSYQAGLAIAQQFGTLDAQGASWSHELALGHNFVARMQRRRGELPAAEASLQAAIAVLQDAARHDPGNAGYQNNLAACYGDLAEVQRGRGDLAGAEASRRAALAIAERSLERDPENAVLLDQLAGCYHRLRLAQGERGDLSGAQATLKALRAVEQRRTRLM
jgi:tetratricopeptide (TPR) repeat protein